MQKLKAAMIGPQGDRLWIELEEEQKVTLGHSAKAGAKASEPTYYGLEEILPDDELQKVKGEHATLTFQEGDFWLENLNQRKVWVNKYALRPDQPFRLVDQDVIRLGQADAKVTFSIPREMDVETGPAPSQYK